MSFARRAVLDTGVPVSAAIRPDSIPALALEKALLNFDVRVSRDTFAELETELIVSSDPHLTGMHPWRGIPILPPAAILVWIP